MKKITLFYQEFCPYCVKAKRAVGELCAENASYGGLSIDWIEENRESALAARYDYYYVPTIFDGQKKLYEADPSQDYDSIKASIRAAFDAALT